MYVKAINCTNHVIRCRYGHIIIQVHLRIPEAAHTYKVYIRHKLLSNTQMHHMSIRSIELLLFYTYWMILFPQRKKNTKINNKNIHIAWHVSIIHFFAYELSFAWIYMVYIWYHEHMVHTVIIFISPYVFCIISTQIIQILCCCFCFGLFFFLVRRENPNHPTNGTNHQFKWQSKGLNVHSYTLENMRSNTLTHCFVRMPNLLFTLFCIHG